MPKNLRADIEWHKARIAFYQQALEELETDQNAPDDDAGRPRAEEIRAILFDLERTLARLAKVLAQSN